MRQGIALPLYVPNAVGLGVVIVWDLVEVSAHRAHQPELIGRAAVEYQRGEAAEAVDAIVDYSRGGVRQPQIAAVSIHAPVVGEALGVAAEADLIVGLPELPEAGDDLGFPVAFESGSRNDIEDGVTAVAIFGGVAAALHLEIIDVLRIELRGD